MGKLKNGKAASKDEVTRKMVVGWIWRLYNMGFKSVVPEHWRCTVIVPLYKGNGEKTEYKDYRSISLLKSGWKESVE